MVNLDIVILFIPVLLSEAAIEFVHPFPTQVQGILHKNLTLSCHAFGEFPLHTFWMKNGEPITDTWGLVHKEELRLNNINHSDAGDYTCVVQDRHEKQTLSTHLTVASPPDKLVNVSIHPTTIIATVSWRVFSDGGYPVTNYTIVYRQLLPKAEFTWHRPIPEHISPAVHQFDIFKLKPNSTYQLKIWACNKLGAGEETLLEFVTLKETDPLELARHMLADGDEYTVTAWILAVSFVLGTIVILCVASCILLYKEWEISRPADARFYEDDDNLRLLNHMFLKSGSSDLSDNLDFYHQINTDENFNSDRSFRYYNNNSVVHPCRV